jgi:transposase-like protein
MIVMEKCPACNSTTRQVKIGFTAAGSQRFECKLCLHRYTPSPKMHGYHSDMVEQAIRLHRQGISNRAIGRILRVNHQTIANWIKQNDPSFKCR